MLFLNGDFNVHARTGESQVVLAVEIVARLASSFLLSSCNWMMESFELYSPQQVCAFSKTNNDDILENIVAYKIDGEDFFEIDSNDEYLRNNSSCWR